MWKIHDEKVSKKKCENGAAAVVKEKIYFYCPERKLAGAEKASSNGNESFSNLCFMAEHVNAKLK